MCVVGVGVWVGGGLRRGWDREIGGERRMPPYKYMHALDFPGPWPPVFLSFFQVSLKVFFSLTVRIGYTCMRYQMHTLTSWQSTLVDTEFWDAARCTCGFWDSEDYTSFTTWLLLVDRLSSACWRQIKQMNWRSAVPKVHLYGHN